VKTKNNRPGGAAGLRRRAEEIFREKAAGSPEKPEAQAPEENRLTLQELRVHQIELEMQNDELRDGAGNPANQTTRRACATGAMSWIYG
jgi:hypothetical protein